MREGLVALLKDPAAFVADYETALDAAERAPGEKRPKVDLRLQGLRVEGDRANASLALPDGGPPLTVQFVKVGGGWRVYPLDGLRDPEGPAEKGKGFGPGPGG